jgi:tRNA modification GTPase
MQGVFSEKITSLLQELIELRVYVEAAIDFPEEEIDFLADDNIRQRLSSLLLNLKNTIDQAGQGAILRSGLSLVLAGKPNAGKSSLLNALAGEQTAIVTDVPGTTRDTIRQTISLDGLPVHIIDTAGLRDTDDVVEKIGVERARAAIKDADHVLLLVDATEPDYEPLAAPNHTLVFNKIDLVDVDNLKQKELKEALFLSVKTGLGMTELRSYLKSLAGYQSDESAMFTARRRHITALEVARDAVHQGITQLQTNNAGELLADELRQAQKHLSEITGEFSADDLLGEIFAGFCIGK